MDAAELLRQLCESLERAGLSVRHERLGGEGGGICRMGGKYAVFIDLDADTETQLRRCIASLSILPHVDSLYLPPQIREQIEQN